MSENEPPADALGHSHRRARRPAGLKRLARSSRVRIGGVAEGLAEFVDAGPVVLRGLWLISIPLTGGLSAVVYLLLWALLPASE